MKVRPSAGPGDAANKPGAQQKGQANYTEIQTALGFIPADDREIWTRVGMAIRSELGVGGFQIWNEWSRTSDKYQEQAARDVWKSFNGSGVGIGTLFGIARQHGYRPARPSLSLEDQWNEATPATSHPYLKRKAVKSQGLRVLGDTLLIPVRSVAGDFKGFQRVIKEDGQWVKKFAAGTKKTGHFHSLGDVSGSYVVLVAEGYATGAAIHEATGYPVIVAFDSGNLEPVCKAIRAKYPDKTIAVCGDDDNHLKVNDGRNKAEKAARAVGGIAIFPQFEKPAERGRNDFNDLLRESGPDSVLDQIEAGLSKRDKRDKNENVPPRLPADYISVDGLENERFQKTWVVEGLLEEGRAYQVFGAWKSGKTLAALDLCAHLSLGLDWAGRRTVPALVVWVASESCDDVKRRISAWRLNHQVTGSMPFVIRTKPLHLDQLQFAEQLAGEIQTIRAMNPGLPVVTVIDTVARSMSGEASENDEGLRKFSNYMLDFVVRPLNVTALFVHHSGHGNSERGRGWSGFPAALDGTIKVSIDKSVEGTFVDVETTEMRSTPGQDFFRFRVDTQEIHGSDNFGNVISEPVLLFTGEQPAKRESTMGKRPPKGSFEALEILQGMICQYTDNLRASGLDGDPRVELRDWRQAVYNSMGQAKANTKKKSFLRVLDALKSAGEIHTDEMFVYLGESPILGNGTKRDKTGQCPDLSRLDNGTNGTSGNPPPLGGSRFVPICPPAIGPGDFCKRDKFPEGDERHAQAVIPSGEPQGQDDNVEACDMPVIPFHFAGPSTKQ